MSNLLNGALKEDTRIKIYLGYEHLRNLASDVRKYINDEMDMIIHKDIQLSRYYVAVTTQSQQELVIREMEDEEIEVDYDLSD